MSGFLFGNRSLLRQIEQEALGVNNERLGMALHGATLRHFVS